MKFTEEQLSGFTDKDSKKPEYRELYEQNDFVTAYAAHTDKRIEIDGPELAIGAKRDGLQDWEIHAQAQLGFLTHRGLKPEHRLLDFGCGTGRLASVAVPYLDKKKYYGLDISAGAIEHAFHTHENDPKKPIFMVADGSLEMVKEIQFDYIWAHSVFTHLPPDIIQNILADLSHMDFGEFLFTYKQSENPQRSGLKQFQYSIQSLKDAAHNFGLKAEPLNIEWPAGQKTMRVWK